MWDKARGRKQKDRPLREKARGRRAPGFFGEMIQTRKLYAPDHLQCANTWQSQDRHPGFPGRYSEEPYDSGRYGRRCVHSAPWSSIFALW